MIGQTFAQYKILEKLGEGGMGVVYKAEDTRLERIVALKFLPHHRAANEEDQSRFLQEAKAASALNHPNVCTIHDIRQTDGQQYIVMEYVEGTTLHEKVPLQKFQDVLSFAIQIGEALQEAHGKGIVHRDIKSENIMVTTRNQVKVMDFGLAKLKGSLKLTRTSGTVGTLGYMAPEQIQGGEVDARSDIFSFGVVLFEMATGQLPFRGEHEAAVMYSILNEEPERADRYRPDCPSELLHVLARTLEKDPEDRYQSVQDMLIDLRRLKKQSTRISRPSSSVSGAERSLPHAGGAGTEPPGRFAAAAAVPPPPADSPPPWTPATASHPSSAQRPMAPASSGAFDQAPPPAPFTPPGGEEESRTKRRRKVLLLAGAVSALVLIAVLGAAVILLDRKPSGGGSSSASGQATAGGRTMLAVLPFENLGAADQEYFAEGMTEEITGRLSGISGLGVIARTSAMQYKKTTKSLQQIGDELHVGYVLQGTIRWGKTASGAMQVRVSPALVKVSDATEIWSQPYESVFSDVFKIQSEIAAQVATALGVTLRQPDQKNLETQQMTANSEAYDSYVRGNNYYGRSYLRRDFEIAIQMFQKAVALDPNFAQAYAHLSRTHSAMYWFHYDHTPERISAAKAAVEKAFSLSPDAPEAHEAFGYYYYWDYLDYDNALKEFAIAEKSHPSDGHILFAIGAVQRRQGKFDLAAASMAKACELDPRSSEVAGNASQTYRLLRNFPEAERQVDRSISLAPDLTERYVDKIALYLAWDGNTRRARTTLQQALALPGAETDVVLTYQRFRIEILDANYAGALSIVSSSPVREYEDQFFYLPKAQVLSQIYRLMKAPGKERSWCDSARIVLEEKARRQPEDPRYHSALGLVFAALGRKDDAVREAKRGTELLPVSREAWRGAYRIRDLAEVYTIVGEYDAAIDQLQLLLSMPSDLSPQLVRLDPVWAPLRSSPRFHKLIGGGAS